MSSTKGEKNHFGENIFLQCLLSKEKNNPFEKELKKRKCSCFLKLCIVTVPLLCSCKIFLSKFYFFSTMNTIYSSNIYCKEWQKPFLHIDEQKVIP